MPVQRFNRLSNFPPSPPEVAEVVERLRAENVTPPAAAAEALDLAHTVYRDIPSLAARLDQLPQPVTPDALWRVLRETAADIYLTRETSLPTEAADLLTARAVAALAADVDEMLDRLRPRWDTAARQLAAAAAAGIGPATSSADVIAAGDAAVAAWRTLEVAVGTLDRLMHVRNNLLWITGREVEDADLDTGLAVWLQRAAAGPVQLTSAEPRSAYQRPDLAGIYATAST